jgi:hypothetical protein
MEKTWLDELKELGIKTGQTYRPYGQFEDEVWVEVKELLGRALLTKLLGWPRFKHVEVQGCGDKWIAIDTKANK